MNGVNSLSPKLQNQFFLLMTMSMQFTEIIVKLKKRNIYSRKKSINNKINNVFQSPKEGVFRKINQKLNITGATRIRTKQAFDKLFQSIPGIHDNNSKNKETIKYLYGLAYMTYIFVQGYRLFNIMENQTSFIQKAETIREVTFAIEYFKLFSDLYLRTISQLVTFLVEELFMKQIVKRNIQMSNRVKPVILGSAAFSTKVFGIGVKNALSLLLKQLTQTVTDIKYIKLLNKNALQKSINDSLRIENSLVRSTPVFAKYMFHVGKIMFARTGSLTESTISNNHARVLLNMKKTALNLKEFQTYAFNLYVLLFMTSQLKKFTPYIKRTLRIKNRSGRNTLRLGNHPNANNN